MEAMKQKWDSCRGASILLALLFLLVCMMVGASVLMAAASNVGKMQSNKKEQQNYFIVSSALNLFCDELQSVQYQGKFTYEIEANNVRVKDDTADPPEYYTDRVYTYTQQVGELSLRSGGALSADDFNALKELLPLYNDFDVIFAKEFSADKNFKDYEGDTPAGVGRDTNEYKYSQDSAVAAARTTYTLEVKLPAEYGDFLVTITVSVAQDGRIYLYSSLKDDSDFTMRAILSPTDHKGPGDLKASDDSGNPVGDTGEAPSPGADPGTWTYTTTAVTWTLENVEKVNNWGDDT